MEDAQRETAHFPGFFHLTGTFWRVNRENVLMLMGGYALLLQLAHPLVAAGVNEHSGFREHPLRRLYSTMRTMQQLTCGDRATALAAALATSTRCTGTYRGR